MNVRLTSIFLKGYSILLEEYCHLRAVAKEELVFGPK